ncbi:MAG: hypothetical protein K2H24_00005, partial [Clostridia bacterium]|nr:hypothetical protein [Clostridia bacterium]
MNLAKSKSKYLKCAILIIAICLILGALSACLPFNISLPDTLKDEEIDNTAVTITPNASDGLGEFNNGYSYVYTNKDLIDKYRAGDPSTPYDISIVKVDTSQARGTQKNPYVIATIADWETFVKFCGTDLTKSTGKYFVLANDIDFAGVDFHPVGKFGGTFYGMGHKLINIVCSNWQYWNGTDYVAIGTSGQTNSGFGVFCSATNATITDLINENYSYSNFSQSSANGVGTLYGPYVAGIVGISFGNNFLLNCHSKGDIQSSITFTTYFISGGIVGTHTSSESNKTVFLYRCTSNFFVSAKTDSLRGVMAGGLIGQTWSQVTVLDCASDISADYGGARCVYIATVLGWSETPTETFYFENIVGKVDIETTYQNYSGALAGIRGSHINFANTYIEGTIGAGTKSSLYAVTISLLSGQSIPTSGVRNVNVVKSSTNYATPYSGCSDGLERISTEPTEYSTSSEMLSAAKVFFGNASYSNIWDVDKIGGSYDPDNSPVRNYLMAFINFRNLNNYGNNEEKVGLDDGEPYIAGDKLPDETSDVTAFTTYLNTKASANHVFLGWTDDKTGASEPFTELPSGYFGKITLYAVWGLPQSYVTNNIKTSITSDKDKIEY